MNITTVINQKGGVGKSTTVHALGSGLITKGYKVLFIDLDAQGNLSYALRANKAPKTVLEVLTKEVPIEQAIYRKGIGDTLRSSPHLAGADTLLVETGREYRLKEALDPIRENYDFIIIDTPPSLGILTINALTTSNGAIIPTQADIFSLQGIVQLSDTINSVKRYTNPDVKILGILLTRYNGRTILSQDLTVTLEGMAAELNTRVYGSKIREAIAIKEAQAIQESIYTYAPKGNATSDYIKFLDEYLNQVKENQE